MSSHSCPKQDCKITVPSHQLACRVHWFQIPSAIRTAVWRTWDNGRGAGTPEHTAALRAAITAMNGDTDA